MWLRDQNPCINVDPSTMLSRYLMSLYYVPVVKQNPAHGAYIIMGNIKGKQSWTLVKVERSDFNWQYPTVIGKGI